MKMTDKDKRIIRDFKLEIEEAYKDRFWRRMLMESVKRDYRKMFPHLHMHFA